MPGVSPSSLSPAALPVGTLVGRWRVVAWAGRGTHGAVYRAVPADKEHASPVALKLALVPRNPRLVREAELLSRLRNPSIPRLWDEGEWHHPGGDFFPYVAMEWIAGAPLYAWARQQPFSAALQEPVRRLLSVQPEKRGTVAQLAEELERAARPRTRVAVRAAEPPPPASLPEVKHRGTEDHRGEKPSPARARPRRRARRVWPWLATAASGLVVVWVGGRAVGTLGENFSVRSSGAARADAGTTGLGETVSATSSAVDAPESSLPFMADEPFPEPLPEQIRPNAKGRCPLKRQVALNGACWVAFEPDPAACEASGGQLFQGRCYVPALPRKRPSTAQPSLKPE